MQHSERDESVRLQPSKTGRHRVRARTRGKPTDLGQLDHV